METPPPPPPPVKRRRRIFFPPALKHFVWIYPSTNRRRGLRFYRVKGRRGVGPVYAFKPRKVKPAILLLFETPSGFAIFSFCPSLFELEDPMEFIWAEFAENWASNSIIWLNHFQTFEDKSNAINENTGVSERLVEMIRKWHCPGQKMAVGKPEYKKIIEDRLGIKCLYGPLVMELMWGIQRWLPSAVREEKSQLTEGDRLPLSQGLQEFLSRYDSDVKPEMVNDKIIETAAFLYFECDSIEKDHSVALLKAGDCIKNISGISCEGWSLLKIATALKIICRPEEAGNSCEMIPPGMVSKLVKDAPLYDAVLDLYSCLWMYDRLMYARKVRLEKKKLLESLIKDAKEAYEAEQAEDRTCTSN